MGCINVEVWPVVLYNISTSVSCISGRNISVNKVGGDLEVNIELTPPSILTTARGTSTGFSTSVVPCNNRLDVSITIVCTTSTGDEVFLEVTEGMLITIDGQYIKVLKDGV